MSRKKRDAGGDECGNWMDTYGDMVTLLMTFFVMLYSMSNLDAKKWEVFVRSISPETGAQQQIDLTINGEVDYDKEMESLSSNLEIPSDDEVTAEDLYLVLADALEARGVEGVELSRGEDYTFVVFQDKTFFGSDSSELTQQGKEVLDVVCDVLARTKDAISQINIMGHTTQADPNRPNNVRPDRMLSSMRASEVCIYIQEKNVIEPEKLVSIGYGMFRPLSSVETEEGRTRNRRVELLLVDEGASGRSLNEYYQDYLDGINSDKTITTQGNAGNTENNEGSPEFGGMEEVNPGSDEISPDMMPYPEDAVEAAD